MKREMTIDQAMKYRVPFGEHKGKLLIDVAQDNIPLIEWIHANLNGKVAEAARIILEDIKWRRKVGWSPRRSR